MRESLPVVDLLRGLTPPRVCSYLPDEESSLEYRLIPSLSREGYNFLLERGWRRQGLSIFRPACAACSECVSLRVDVQNFRPRKSQRKVLRRNADVRVSVQRATISTEHIELFNAWHRDMHTRSGWPYHESAASDYFESFLSRDCDYAMEFRYYRGDRLIGVGLVDELEEAASSVYFYHAPDWRPDSPGTFSALQEIERTRDRGGRWLYLGYRVAGCQSMSYKNRFRPHEILAEYVADEDEPSWIPPEE